MKLYSKDFEILLGKRGSNTEAYSIISEERRFPKPVLSEVEGFDNAESRKAKSIRIGTRASKLALIQANQVREALLINNPDLNLEIVPVQTTGDKFKTQPLTNIGGKGLFIKELEEALLEKKIEVAVHSLKDVPATIPSGLTIDTFLRREDPRDTFLSNIADSIHDLPQGSVVGTGSPRRSIELLRVRPDLKIIPFRGNVESRIEKLNNNVVDATILAVAGLTRLGVTRKHHILELEEMIPAVGQGVICVECRDDDENTLNILQSINDAKTKNLVLAERGFVETIGGNCYTPLGANARYVDGKIKLIYFLASEDGKQYIKGSKIGLISEAYKLGQDSALEILKSIATRT